MKRRDLLAGLVAMASLAGPALAQDFVAGVIAQLREQNFRSVEEERTLLGRVRIVAERGDGQREIIINPRNGEILRDLWTPIAGGSGTIDIIHDKSGRGSGDDDDKDDDDEDGDDDHDDDNDDDDDDNSGSGGGGGGGSGGGGGGGEED